MGGFVSGGRSFGGGVVSRVAASGAVWSWRSAVAGQPAPGAVCVPLRVPVAQAREVARSLAASVPAGWAVSLRRSRRVACAAWEVKVCFPSRVVAAQVRAVLVACGLAGAV